LYEIQSTVVRVVLQCFRCVYKVRREFLHFNYKWAICTCSIYFIYCRLRRDASHHNSVQFVWLVTPATWKHGKQRNWVA